MGKGKSASCYLGTLVLRANEDREVEIIIPAEISKSGKPEPETFRISNTASVPLACEISVVADPSQPAGFRYDVRIRKPTNGEIRAFEGRIESDASASVCVFA